MTVLLSVSFPFTSRFSSHSFHNSSFHFEFIYSLEEGKEKEIEPEPAAETRNEI